MDEYKDDHKKVHKNQSEFTTKTVYIDGMKVTVTSNTPSPEAIKNFNRAVNLLAQERLEP